MDFRTKTIRQIKIWSWAAAVLPITALSGLFFVWRFFDGSWLSTAFIIGETVMFAVAVIWWWWAMYTMRNLVKHWDETRDNVRGVVTDVREMKNIVLDLLSKDK